MTTDADSIPNDFTCPLTLTLFEDPLVSKHGHSFERRAILEWLAEGNTTCPITRKPLTPSMLFPNAALRMRVKSWEKENCYSDGDNGSDDEETSGHFVCRSGVDALMADRLYISFSDATDATSRGRRSRSSRRSTTSSTGEGRRDSTGSAQSSNTRRRRFLFSR